MVGKSGGRGRGRGGGGTTMVGRGEHYLLGGRGGGGEEGGRKEPVFLSPGSNTDLR